MNFPLFIYLIDGCHFLAKPSDRGDANPYHLALRYLIEWRQSYFRQERFFSRRYFRDALLQDGVALLDFVPLVHPRRGEPVERGGGRNCNGKGVHCLLMRHVSHAFEAGCSMLLYIRVIATFTFLRHKITELPKLRVQFTPNLFILMHYHF